MNIFSDPASFILMGLLFGATIFIHELGHFLVALWRKMHVEVFSIGFPPKMVWKQYKGVTYQIGWIPLGGYVALPQMDTSADIPQSSDGEELKPASPLDKILTAIAGPAMNILFAFVIAFVLFQVGIPKPPEARTRTIGYVAPESYEASAGLLVGDEITSIDGAPIEHWVDIRWRVALVKDDAIRLGVEREGKDEHIEIPLDKLRPDGQTADLLQLQIAPEMPVIIDGLTSNAPAYRAGLKTDDRILSIDGQNMTCPEMALNYLSSKTNAIQFVVERDGEEHSIQVEPKWIGTVRDVDYNRFMVGMSFFMTTPDVNDYWQLTHIRPTALVRDIVVQTFRTLRALTIDRKKTGVKAKHMSGVVGIASHLKRAIDVDFRLGLWMLVLLNVNLAILNMLPLPVLDGGHITFSLIQVIFRRPLPSKIINLLQYAFMAFLLSFMLYVTYWDVKRELPPSKEKKSERELHIQALNEALLAPDESAK